MDVKLIYIVVFSITFISCGVNSVNQKDDEYLSKVEVNYNQYCVSCHGKQGNKGLGGAANLKKVKNKKIEKIYRTIINGKGNMPSFKKIMTEEDILELANYVRTLGND